MTNGKKLLGVGIFTFLAVTAGSIAFEVSIQTSMESAAEPTEVASTTTTEIAPIQKPEAPVDPTLGEFPTFTRDETPEAPPTTQPPVVSVFVASSDNSSRWDQLAVCESGGNWGHSPVSGGFSGGIMFHIDTWLTNGGGQFAPDAYLATREQQITVAEKVLERSGWRAWPGCSQKFGWI